jgi:hypothetical protein
VHRRSLKASVSTSPHFRAERLLVSSPKLSFLFVRRFWYSYHTHLDFDLPSISVLVFHRSPCLCLTSLSSPAYPTCFPFRYLHFLCFSGTDRPVFLDDHSYGTAFKFVSKVPIVFLECSSSPGPRGVSFAVTSARLNLPLRLLEFSTLLLKPRRRLASITTFIPFHLTSSRVQVFHTSTFLN